MVQALKKHCYYIATKSYEKLWKSKPWNVLVVLSRVEYGGLQIIYTEIIQNLQFKTLQIHLTHHKAHSITTF